MTQGSAGVRTFDRETKEQQSYWTERLAGGVTPAGLRPDFIATPGQDAKRGRLGLALPDELRPRLSRLTGDSPLLTYALLLASLKACLYRYTGLGRVVVGGPPRRDGEDPAPNALALLDEVRGDESFRDLLLRVRENLIGAYARQDYPFDLLLRDLGLEAAGGRCPLFDVALTFSELNGEMPDVGAPLVFNFERRPDGGLAGEATYDAGSFSRESVERFVGHYLNFLSGALEEVGARVSDIEMLSDDERRLVLGVWNDTRADYPDALCVHQLFEEQAALRPEAPAVVTPDVELTYGELNRRANRFARSLRRLGAGPEVAVGVMLESSRAALVALLGVLKSGGAYLPLDPSYPPERLRFMLEDARVSLLITRPGLREELSRDYAGRVVTLEDERDDPDPEGDENLPPAASPDSLAYVIYTSGSTGTPKGVMVAHRGICNLAAAQARAFDVRPESRVVQFAPLSFDASVSEIFMALTAGATLCLGARETLYLETDFVPLLRGLSVTTATLPPAVLSLLNPLEFPDIQTVISAGESCTPDLVARWAPGRRFFNAYGPTEATVCATVAECTADEPGAPPIGRPISNVRVYLLDAGLNPVPVGVRGELCVAGAGLARGYLGRPSLTADRFLPDHFSHEPGARLYRTGDLARWLADGQLEFLGRDDQQVKVRGFRIEPGEVEAALSAHESVRDCVVVAQGEAAHERRLVAYYVAAAGREVDAAALQEFARERLPAFMVPSVFVALDELPLTPSGKVDRLLLPAPEPTSVRGAEAFVAPSTPTEKKLAEIWAELLGITAVDVDDHFLVSIHDHFFNLGGHSLLAIKMFSRVREAFGVELPLNLIFTSAPTIAGLARTIEQYMIEAADSDKVSAMLLELDELTEEEIEALLASDEATA